MSVPVAIDAARRISDNLGKGIREARDQNNIDRILSEAMKANNPEVFQNSISQILSQVSPENQGTAIQYLQSRYKELKDQQLLEKQTKAALASGINPHLDPALQKVQYEHMLQNARARSFGLNLPDQSIIPASDAPAQGSKLAPGTPPMMLAQGQNQSNITQQAPEAQGFRALSDDKLVALSGVKGFSEPAKQELRRRQEERKIQNDLNKEVFKKDLDRSSKILEKADESALALPQKRSALNLMKDAILQKDMSFWSGDNLAEITGIEALRSPEGALFKTAGKEYFLGSIARAGARPNQWVEQQISDMLTKIGRSTEANLSVERALQNELDLEEERVRLTNEISDRLRSQGDLSQGKLGSLVHKGLSEFADKKQSELFNDLRAIKAIAEKNPQIYKKVDKGTKVSKVVAQALLKQFNNDPEKAAAEAKKLGYEF